MELLLNIVWWAMSVGITCALPVLRRGRAPRGGRYAVARICVIALLFPVISITDDLACDRAEVDASTSIRRTSSSSMSPAFPSHSHVAVIPRRVYLPPVWSIVRFVVGTQTPVDVIAFCASLLRAPPSSLHTAVDTAHYRRNPWIADIPFDINSPEGIS
jgi:hypothetical protein